MVTKAERRDKLGGWDQHRSILLYIKFINNEDLLYSTRNYTQYFIIIIMEINMKRNIHIYD